MSLPFRQIMTEPMWIHTLYKMIKSNNPKKLTNFLVKFPEHSIVIVDDILIYAIQNFASCEILDILLQHGANLLPESCDGSTLLIISINENKCVNQIICEWVITSIDKMINDKNIDDYTINEYVNMYDFTGTTALLYAMDDWYNNQKTIEYLLIKGCNPLICDLELKSTLNCLINNNCYKLFDNEKLNNLFFTKNMIKEYGSHALEVFLNKVIPLYDRFRSSDEYQHHYYVIDVITRLMTLGATLSLKSSLLLDNPSQKFEYINIEAIELIMFHIMKILHTKLHASINNIIINYIA
jgi:hypothetical protein